MILRASAAFAVACQLASVLPVTADDVSPPFSDPAEGLALLDLGFAEHEIAQHRYAAAVPILEGALARNTSWDRVPWLRLFLAIAHRGIGDSAQSLADCVRLRDLYRASNPLVAAWAQHYIGENLERLGGVPGAMAAYRETDSFLPGLTDLGPVLKSRQKAAEYFLGHTACDPNRPDHPQLLGFDPRDREAWAWAHAAICANRAWCGDVEAAYREYGELVAALPVGDRRVAVAAIDLAMGEIDAYDAGRRVKMALLVDAQRMIRAVEAAFPRETWLVAKAKIRMAEFELGHRVGLPDAAKYLREVLAQASDTDLAPQAWVRLASVLYAQQRYQEAANEFGAAASRYPYSTWADFANYMWADSLYRAGNKEGALAVADRLLATYPRSSWAALSAVMKEAHWR